MKNAAIAALCASVFTIPMAHAQEQEHAEMSGAEPGATATLEGEGIEGTVSFTETASGILLVKVEASGIPAGTHGFHIHETGACEADGGFESAGGHLAGDKEHGIMNENGPHPGDLPNIHVGEDGELMAEYFAHGLTLGEGEGTSLMDEDGSAIMIHAGPDDYMTDPSGHSGDRIACGVIESAS